MENQERIINKVIDGEMKTSYLGYSMSVIVGRALPDVRDGLKPVHRRVLFGMYEMGVLHNKAFKKSARIVGDVMGKYHPHGDSAIYDALVRLAQNFSLRYPLVQGQGNFGSIDGDNAAAMRYTEARLNKLAEELLQDLDKETIDFIPNYDGSLKEPSVMPAKVPNLLINGSSGIAVGMATNVPPHNMTEVCEAVIKTIDNPNIEIRELTEYVQAPDFPTGGVILGRTGIKEAYETGRGKVIIRGKISVEEVKQRTKLIITEIPYQVNKSMLVEEIAELVKDKKVQGVSDLRDESDRDGLRVVIELKSGANADVVMNQLFSHSRLQVTFGIIMLALVNNQPKVLTLKEIITEFINHRKDIVTKRTAFDLREAEKKAHIIEGLIIALNNIDTAIALIKKSKSTESARQQLQAEFKLTEIQANAILDMKLQKLTNLEQQKIREEYKGLLEKIAELKSILASQQKILNIIKSEMQELKDNYGDKRRTNIIDGDATVEEESLIKPEDDVVTVTQTGYVKRIPLETYKQQHRSGKGIIAITTKEEDVVDKVFIANTRDFVLFFTNKGKVHWLKVYQLPEASRQARGGALVNLLQLEEGELVSAVVPVKEFGTQYLFFVTRNGTVKKTAIEEFSRPRKGGIIALTLPEDDQLIEVFMTDGKREIIIATEEGMAIRFSEEDVRAMGRTAYGVIGIKLKEDDKVIGAMVADETKTLLVVTENGYGKRSSIDEYRLIGRGGIGVINMNLTDKTGKVIGIKEVDNDNDLMLISKKGVIIRIPTNQISVIGRNTQGVRLMRLDEGDKVASIAAIEHAGNSADQQGA